MTEKETANDETKANNKRQEEERWEEGNINSPSQKAKADDSSLINAAVAACSHCVCVFPLCELVRHTFSNDTQSAAEIRSSVLDF